MRAVITNCVLTALSSGSTVRPLNVPVFTRGGDYRLAVDS